MPEKFNAYAKTKPITKRQEAICKALIADITSLWRHTNRQIKLHTFAKQIWPHLSPRQINTLFTSGFKISKPDLKQAITSLKKGAESLDLPEQTCIESITAVGKTSTRKSSYPVIPDRLKLAVKTAGKSLEQASTDMGFGKNYLSNAGRLGLIPPWVLQRLSIPLEDATQPLSAEEQAAFHDSPVKFCRMRLELTRIRLGLTQAQVSQIAGKPSLFYQESLHQKRIHPCILRALGLTSAQANTPLNQSEVSKIKLRHNRVTKVHPHRQGGLQQQVA